MNNNALKELSIYLAEIEAVKIEVAGMNSANAERISRGEALAYPEESFSEAAGKIRFFIKKMQAIDTRPGVS